MESYCPDLREAINSIYFLFRLSLHKLEKSKTVSNNVRTYKHWFPNHETREHEHIRILSLLVTFLRNFFRSCRSIYDKNR